MKFTYRTKNNNFNLKSIVSDKLTNKKIKKRLKNKRSKNWLAVWNKNGKNLILKKTQDLLNANGHNSPMGTLNKDEWLNYVKDKIKKIKLKKNENILEYGCGSGAFLSYFYNKGFNLYGIDYSRYQIQKARKYFSKIKFKTGEISKIDSFNVKFNFIFSNLTFHYFDNYSYAKALIDKMIKNLKSNGSIFITNIPDKDKEQLFKKELINQIGIKEFKKKYSYHTHLFYKKLFFKQIAKKNNLKIKIFNESLKFSKNFKYRYNVILKKKSNPTLHIER
tara:strand:- start:940 stop:1770 length:831 start_codon:yes stop_codon:yes gene_type:complete